MISILAGIILGGICLFVLAKLYMVFMDFLIEREQNKRWEARSLEIEERTKKYDKEQEDNGKAQRLRRAWIETQGITDKEFIDLLNQTSFSDLIALYRPR